MSLNATSLAAAVGAGVKNEQFAATANNIPHKILIIGTYDPSLTSTDETQPQLVTSAESAGAKFGFGYMIHRLAKAAFRGSQGVETWVLPQAEAGGSTAATDDVVVTAANPVPGNLYMYVAGERYVIPVASDSTSDTIGEAIASAVTTSNSPVTAANVTGTVTLTSKTKGTWGNDISVAFNLGNGEVFPSGVSVAWNNTLGDGTAGTGLPAIADALALLGSGDDQNEQWFTEIIHGYGQDSGTLAALSAWNGEGNELVGNYDKLIARPVRSLVGDVATGDDGLAALLALAEAIPNDRTSGVIPVPGSPNHPSEIAALTVGELAAAAQNVAGLSLTGKTLPGVIPGLKEDRWTSTYDARDIAVKGGIGTTAIVDNAVQIGNVLSFYNPSSVPVESNVFRSMRNISIIQNILAAIKANFAQEKWKGISIVSDVAKVTNTADRLKCKSIDAVIDDLVALTIAFEGHGWIYSASYTLDRLAAGGLVTIRPGGIGFDIVLPVVLSGEGGIIDTLVQMDASLAVFLAA